MNPFYTIGEINCYNGSNGLITIGANANMLKDEVLGKLLKMVDELNGEMRDVAAVEAETYGVRGVLKVTLTMYLNPDRMAQMPSIYDEPAPKKRTKRGKR